MADKKDDDDDVMDEFETDSDEPPQAVVVTEGIWIRLLRGLSPELQIELYQACLRNGPFIVVPRLIWLLVVDCARYRNSN
jgi:hypothetical protein